MLNCYCGEARRLDRRDKRVAAQLWFLQICITMRFDVLEGPEDFDDLVFDEDVLEDPRADADADADAGAVSFFSFSFFPFSFFPFDADFDAKGEGVPFALACDFDFAFFLFFSWASSS